MERQVETEETIKRFLLGELADEEQEQVQYRLLSDSEYFEQFLMVENELTDDFVRGALSECDNQRVTEYFLAVPERRQKLRFAIALDRFISEEGSKVESKVEDVPKGKLRLLSAAGKYLSKFSLLSRQSNAVTSQEPVGRISPDEPQSTQHPSMPAWENILAEAAANRELLSSLVEGDWLGLGLVAEIRSKISTREELAALVESSEAAVTPVLVQLVASGILEEQDGIFSCTKRGAQILERIEKITGYDLQGLNQTGTRM